MAQRMKRGKGSKKSLRLPKDFHWQLLVKLMHDFRHACPTTMFEDELKQLELIVRQRDIKKYMSFCKSSCALKRIEVLASAHLWDVPDGNEFLLQVRFLRILTMLQKFNFPNTPFDQLKTALDAFKKYEALCANTNKDAIFRVFDEPEDSSELTSYDNYHTCKVLGFAREFIQSVVGCVPDHEKFLEMLRHGPGASFGKRGNSSILIEKYIPPLDCGFDARELANECINSDSRWSRSLLDQWVNDYKRIDLTNERFTPFASWLLGNPIEHSRITFVDKDAEKKRTICIEPTMNVFLQLGVDGLIRDGLKRRGIDLNTQSKNQQLACSSSKTNELVTIDLSGASDTVAVAWLKLFPREWQTLLNILRMKSGKIEATDEVVTFEKLSAMGNGFTFTVETLIFSSLFYGLLRVHGAKWNDYLSQSSFYGDDIIIPTRFYPEYSYLLHRLGFRENIDKTFARRSWVRESCGHDYLKGYRVDRPTLKTVPVRFHELVILHNKLVVWAEDYGVELHNTLHYISRYFPINSPKGPINRDEMVSWIFSKEPCGKIYYDVKTQSSFYKIQRMRVSHPLMYYRSSSKGDNDQKRRKKIFDFANLTEKHMTFSPLCYLNSRQPSRSSEDRCYGTFVDKDTMFRFLKDIDNTANGSSLEDYFFYKKLVIVRTSMYRLPVNSWYST